MQRYTVYLYLETVLADAVDTVVCASDDWWKYLPKHVDQFPDINKLCNVASCWIYIGILLGANPILHISRIRVKVLPICTRGFVCVETMMTNTAA
jgi:hypothetical protein